MLDTDAITYDQRAHPLLSLRLTQIEKPDLFTTSTTVEEKLKGRLAYLNRYRDDAYRSSQGHIGLLRTLSYFQTWHILPFSEEAGIIFRDLQKKRVRIGSQDLRIAAIVLLHGFTLVTSNARDFSQVPGLKCEDWTTVD